MIPPPPPPPPPAASWLPILLKQTFTHDTPSDDEDVQIWNGFDGYCWRYRADTILSTDWQTDRRTDGQTDKVKPVYPPFNFIEARGIIIHCIMYGHDIIFIMQNPLSCSGIICHHRIWQTLVQLLECCKVASIDYPPPITTCHHTRHFITNKMEFQRIHI